MPSEISTNHYEIVYNESYIYLSHYISKGSMLDDSVYQGQKALQIVVNESRYE